MIRLLEQEARLGYWPHTEFDWRDAVRTAGELSADLDRGVTAAGYASVEIDPSGYRSPA